MSKCLDVRNLGPTAVDMGSCVALMFGLVQAYFDLGGCSKWDGAKYKVIYWARGRWRKCPIASLCETKSWKTARFVGRSEMKYWITCLWCRSS